jgi:hypothetical protein
LGLAAILGVPLLLAWPALASLPQGKHSLFNIVFAMTIFSGFAIALMAVVFGIVQLRRNIQPVWPSIVGIITGVFSIPIWFWLAVLAPGSITVMNSLSRL